MHLVVDIGNTNIVMGVFKNGELVHRWRINTIKNATTDEIILHLTGLFRQDLRQMPQFKAVALGSVVPSINYPWNNALEKVTHQKPYVVNNKTVKTFNIAYDYPEQIGADRLCNVLAAQALKLNEAVIVDFGTATTFDVFSQNTYWGGVICPGIQTSLMSLTHKASRLADVELYWNTTVVGKNTDDALRNGILFGSLGQIKFIVEKILKEQKMDRAQIIATGGLANLFKYEGGPIHKVIPDLTLIGLNHFISLNS